MNPPGLMPVEPEPAALALAATFTRHLLGKAIRRLANRRGYGQRCQPELLHDVRQEICLDALQNSALIVALSLPDRHQRWFRLTERWIYHQRLSLDRIQHPEWLLAKGDESKDPELATCQLPGLGSNSNHLQALAAHSKSHASGKANLAATAAPLGIDPRRVRRIWERLAKELGYDEEFLRFWRRRLGEALTGLGADLLRDRGECWLLPLQHLAPDPKGRRQRIARIRKVLNVRPLPSDLRRASGHNLAGRGHIGQDPHQVLSYATALAPNSAAAWLWRFEAALAKRDLRDALGSVRQAHRLGADFVTLLLARARLREAAGKLAFGIRLLQRHSQRPGRDGVRLRAALESATATVTQRDGGPGATTSTGTKAEVTPRDGGPGATTSTGTKAEVTQRDGGPGATTSTGTKAEVTQRDGGPGATTSTGTKADSAAIKASPKSCSSAASGRGSVQPGKVANQP